MRTSFHRQLDGLRTELGRMCELTESAARHATCALLELDAEAAGHAHAEAEQLHAAGNALERNAISILARQAPVAGELRTVLAAIRIAADAGRMGGLAAHIAQTSVRCHPAAAVPDELCPTFAQMGELAIELAEQCRVAVLTSDCAQARRIGEGGAAMEDLHRSVFTKVTSSEWVHESTVAMDAVLLGRFYGRFADHAGEIARRVSFQATGNHVLV
jgi:phosphate transport system protein